MSCITGMSLGCSLVVKGHRVLRGLVGFSLTVMITGLPW